MMVCTKSLCLSFLVVLLCFLALPRLADEEPINSRSGRDSSYNEDSHVVLTNPLQGAGVVSPSLGSKSQAVVEEKSEDGLKDEEQKEQHPLPVLTQHPILMQPSLADFKEVAVGMPQMKAITINNPSPSQALQLTSVSGDTPDFHPSFFQSKVVRPGESTTFDIVFLPRRVGRVGTVLYIHTSLGTFKYEVYGTGIPNPYRLRAFLGIKIPANATYSPIVHMYNPHSTPLQITEIYSSGGDLHLELLTGQPEGTKSLWEIRPYETKPIIKLSFYGRSINNHTAFIRIKTNFSMEDSPIALPVEVKVTQATGIFLSREFIDFGLLKSGDDMKPVPLYLLNAGPGSVHVSSISTVPPNDAIQIQYTPTTLRQGAKYVKIASILYHIDKVKDHSQHHGKIVVVFEDPSMDILEIPYEATVMQGTITYEKTQTLFKVGKPPFKPVIRNMSLANQFQSPITLYDVRLPSRVQDHFTINLTKTPFILYPNSGWQKPFSVKFMPISSDCQFSTSLRLHTNSSFFTIPLHCYDGKLKYEVQDIDKDSLEYGLMRYTDTISKRFLVININPVKVSITDYRVKSVDHASVELVHVRPSEDLRSSSSSPETGGNYTEYKPLRTPFTIDVGHEAVFEVNVTKPNVKGKQEGEVLVRTSLGKELRVPIFYKVVLGTLQVEPEVVILKDGHPFTEVSANFSAWSFFDQPVKVVSVKPNPPDPKFYYLPPESGMPLLESEKMTEMGNVVYNPSKGDQSAQKPYLGLEEDDGRSSVANWLNSLNGISNQRVADSDARDYKLMRALWNKAKAKKVKGTLVLETDVSSNYEISIEALLHWPSLLPNTTISFPTTLVGNTSVEHVTVRNPSDRPLLVQALTLPVYPSPDSILRLLKNQFNFNTTVFDTSDLTTFYLPDSEAFENAVPTDLSREHHRDAGTVAHSPLTVTSMIPPYSSAVVRVAFSPKVENNFTSLLLLRNNLTILDALTLRGYGAAVKLLFGGKEPGTSSALLFEYTEASLIQCHKELAAANSLRLVKTFTMRNTGQLPVHVLSMGFTGYGCSNYGFVVENCSNDFVLEPNATKDVRVSFTPDFTMSRIQQTLVLHMTQGTELAFLLLATLPHSFLPICYAALPRLDIEKVLSTITAIFMVLLLVAVIVLALYSARYSTVCQYYELDVVHHSGPVFDLNNLTEDGYANRSGVVTGTQAETIRPGKTNCSREGNNVSHCSQASSAVTNCQETSYSASMKLKTPLEDPTASYSQKTLENMVNSSQNSAENSNAQLERRKRDNSQSMEETDHHNLKTPELSNSGMHSTTRASKPVAAVAGTSRNSPGKSTTKTDSCNDGSPLTASVSTTDFASQTPPLNTSGSQAGLPATESTGVVDAPNYPKRKLSRKHSNKAFRHQNAESNTAKKCDSDKKTEAKSTHEKTRHEKESIVDKEDTHEQVVVAVKEKPRDKVKPFTKDAGTGQAIPVEDAPHEVGVDAEDDLDDAGKKDLSAKGKDKKKKSRVPPKKEEKEKKKKDRELEMAEFSNIKRLSSESIEVDSTTSTENLDDENPNGDADEKVVKPDNPINDVKEEAKNSRPNDSPTGQSAPLEEETSKEQPAHEPQANDNQSKRNDKKALQLTEILSDPFSRKPDKTSYNSKKVMNASKKPSTDRTKSASSEEPDDSKPPTPVGGAKIKQKSKQSDGDASCRAATDEQEATKSPEPKVGDGVRLTTPHEIAASLLSKNPAIATRSKMKVEREAKEPPSKGEVVHPATQSPPLGKSNEMLHMEGYPYMHANMPHHPHPRYLDMRADLNRSDQAGALSLHAEPFVPNMFPKDHIYEDPRQMNRMEVSRLQTGKTLGDYMPPSVTQSSRHHYAKKHQENMFGDSKPVFEDPRALRHASMMMHPVQQKVSPTAAEESPVYPGNYHSEHVGLDHHFSYHYSNQEHRPEAYFEEDYSGLQSFDQQLVSRNARPNNLQYNLPDDGVSFHSSGIPGSHNIISASGRKGMSMMQGGGLTLTSPTSMFESPKKQQPSSLPSYQRPCPGYPSSDEGFHPRLSRQHYMQQLQQMKASKQLHRLPPPGLGESQIGEKLHDRGGIPWGTGDELCSDSMNIQMQQQRRLQEQQRRHFLMQQQHHRQHFDMDDYNEMLPSSHTSAASPVFSPHSLNLAPGSGFSSSVYEPKLSAMDLGWDNSKNHDNFQSDVHWGSTSSSDNSSSAVSMLWGGHSTYGSTSSRSLSTSHEEETNSTEPPKFSGNIYGLFDGSGSIWDPAASSTNNSLLPWATQSPQEHKDNTPN